MKKLLMVLLLIILAAAMVFTPVIAKGENANGAVSVELRHYLPPPPPGPPPPPPAAVGSAILNTTGSGKLIVNVNMDTEPNLQDYDVLVFVRYYPPPWPPAPTPPAPPPGPVGIYPDVLDTNAQGQGNATVMLDIDPPAANESIWVLVNIREGPTDPATPPAYTIMGLPIEVPLK